MVGIGFKELGGIGHKGMVGIGFKELGGTGVKGIGEVVFKGRECVRVKEDSSTLGDVLGVSMGSPSLALPVAVRVFSLKEY